MTLSWVLLLSPAMLTERPTRKPASSDAHICESLCFLLVLLEMRPTAWRVPPHSQLLTPHRTAGWTLV